jgi:[acyl-carrier-protein] S-malonyltransferase
MQAAVPVGIGAMAALLGADIETAQKLADAAAEGEVCTVANDNDPSQVVISGHRAPSSARCAGQGLRHQARAAAAGVGALPLPADAARRRCDGRSAGRTRASAPLVPVVANVTASPVSDPTRSATCSWSRSPAASAGAKRLAMEGIGVTHFVEFGGKVLAPMVKRSAPGEVETVSVISMDDIEALLKDALKTDFRRIRCSISPA